MRLLLLLTISMLSACSGPRYVVFFQERSAQLDGQAQNVVARAAARANNNPTSSVKVIGYTDSAGSPSADVALTSEGNWPRYLNRYRFFLPRGWPIMLIRWLSKFSGSSALIKTRDLRSENVLASANINGRYHSLFL